MGDFHWCADAGPQLNGNFIPVVFKYKLLKKTRLHKL